MKTRGAVIWGVAAVLAAAAGCSMISGLDDLGVAAGGGGPPVDGGDAARSEGVDASSAPDAAPGSDAAPDADASSSDAGPDAHVVTVRCNDTECAGRCCISQAGPATCVPLGDTCPAQTIAFTCDEKADCPAGQSCCLLFAGASPYSACANSCQAAGETLCAGDQECAALDDCIPLGDLGFPPMHGKGGCE